VRSRKWYLYSTVTTKEDAMRTYESPILASRDVVSVTNGPIVLGPEAFNTRKSSGGSVGFAL
jgi:hypothetical protein